MQSPFPTIVMATLYLLFVRVAPGYMKDREPYQMKTFLFVFNTAIVVLNAYLSKEVYLHNLFSSYSFTVNLYISFFSLSPSQKLLSLSLSLLLSFYC